MVTGDDPTGESLKAEPLADTCEFDDFMKVDLRVAKIIAAEEVKKSKKLLRVTVNLGGDETREVLAGIKAAYSPDDLVGRLVMYVANLAPEKWANSAPATACSQQPAPAAKTSSSSAQTAAPNQVSGFIDFKTDP